MTTTTPIDVGLPALRPSPSVLLRPVLIVQLSKLSALLRARRERLGVSQVQLAQEINISQQGLSQLERGTREPRATTFLRACHWAGIDPMSLIK